MSERIEFKTTDGVTLRGDFYQAPGDERAIVILTAGFPLLKEHYIAAFAERFQKAGISALAFDYRNWGSSEGLPRFETNLLIQGDDYRDAVTAAARLPGVHPQRVFLYGIGHAGATAIIAAADDPRVAGVVLQSPAISGRRDRTIFGEPILERAWLSRERRTVGEIEEPEYIRFWPDSLDEAKNPIADTVLHGEGVWNFLTEALAVSNAAGTPWVNKLSIQSLLNVVSTEARDFLHKITAPTLYVAFPDDPFTGTAAFHREAFDAMGTNGEFVLIEPTPGNTITDFLLSPIDVEIDFVRRIANLA